MFFMIGVSQKFRNRKPPVVDSLFNKVEGLMVCNFIKETPTQVFFCKHCKIFNNSFFYRTPPVAAFVSLTRLSKDNCHWASANFLFSIKNAMWHGFYQKGLYIFSWVCSLHIIKRNHSNMFLLNKNLSKTKHCSNGYLFWYQGFDGFRQVFVHYLMSIFNDVQINGWLHWA